MNENRILRVVKSGHVAGDDKAVFVASEANPFALVLSGSRRIVCPVLFDDGKVSWITVHGHAIPIGADGKPASAAGKAILGGDKNGATSRKDVVEHSVKSGHLPGHTDAMVRAFGAGQIQTHGQLADVSNHVKAADADKSDEQRAEKGYHSKQVTDALKQHGASKEETKAFLNQRTEHVMGKLSQIHEGLPKLRSAIETDIKKDGLSKERVAAVVSAIIDKTTMRVGSEEYATKTKTGKNLVNENSQDSFGASSLRKSHVSVEGDTVKFTFPGKSRHDWDKSITDPDLAKAVKQLQAVPGEKLMQFKDAKGNVKPFNETHVRDYMAPHGLTPKNIRTHHATEHADAFLRSKPDPKDEKEYEKHVTEAAESTSNLLGNTPAIARKSYINPAVFEAHRARIKRSADMSKPGEGYDFGKRLEELKRQISEGEINPEPLDEDEEDDEKGLHPKHREQQKKEAAASKEDGGFSLPASFSSGAELAQSMALPPGDYVTRSGKVFECGQYPDKNFDLNESEADAAISRFQPVAANVEHRSSPIDGALGGLSKLWRQGKELFAEAVIPRWLHDHLAAKNAPLMPSLEWHRETKSANGVAWTNFPRIEDAALMSAFSAEVKDDPGTVWFDDSAAEFVDMGSLHVDKPLGEETDDDPEAEEPEEDDKKPAAKRQAGFSYGGAMDPIRDMHDHSVRLGAECGGKSRFSADFMTPEGLKKLQKVHDLCTGDDAKHCDAMASRNAMYSDGGTSARKDTPIMGLLNSVKALFRKAGVPEDEITAELKDIAEPNSAPADFSAVDFSKNPLFIAMQTNAEALKAQNEALAAKNAEFAAKFAETDATVQFARDEAELGKLSALPFPKITPAQADGYRKLAKENPAAFAAVLPVLQGGEILAMFSSPTYRAEQTGGTDDATSKLNTLAEARMKQTEEPYHVAFSAVCKDNPELVLRHEATFAGGN